MIRPFSTSDRQKSLGKRIINGLALFLLNAILIYVLNSLLSGLIHDVDEGSILLFLEEKFGRTFSLIYPIVIAPIYEEYIFRNYLSLKREDVTISIALYVICFGAGGNIITLSLNSYKLYARIIVAILVIILFHSNFLKEYFLHKTQNVNALQYSFIILFSSVLFALLHLKNYYPFQPNYFLTYLMILLPRLNIGIVCAYYRINIGIWAGIALHTINNAIAVLV